MLALLLACAPDDTPTVARGDALEVFVADVSCGSAGPTIPDYPPISIVVLKDTEGGWRVENPADLPTIVPGAEMTGYDGCTYADSAGWRVVYSYLAE